MGKTQRIIVSLRRWLEFDDVERLLTQCLADVGGIESFVHRGQSVVVKPNLVLGTPPSSGGIAHRELVEALLRQVQRCQPSRIVVAEGTPVFGSSQETAFLHDGWREMAARMGIELYNLDVGPHVEVMVDRPHYPYPLPFPKIILDADVFITVPCLKTHITADYTVALKNAFGQTPQWKRSEIHSQYLLEEALVDLNRIRKPDLCIVDGWDGVEGVGGGISYDHPAGARVMLASADPVAVDVVSREVMERTASTRYLRWAIEDGLGIGDLASIEIRGDALVDCQHRFMSPMEEACQALPQVTAHDQDACSGCRCLATSVLWRFKAQKMRQPFHIVYGKEGDLPAFEGQTVVMGDCAARYAACGTYVVGCPPKAGELFSAFEASGCFCHRCRDLAEAILPELSAELRAWLQVSASGAQMYAGERMQRDQWHLSLLVGDCMAGYAHAQHERAAQFGIDPQHDIAWVEGCPPDESAVREALQRLEARLAVVAQKT
jgi:uncharacterized protein (DUF362 family)